MNRWRATYVLFA